MINIRQGFEYMERRFKDKIRQLDEEKKEMRNNRNLSEKKKGAIRNRHHNLSVELAQYAELPFERSCNLDHLPPSHAQAIRKYEIEKRKKSKKARDCIKSNRLALGCASDYFDFLDAYVEAGGKPTHHYPYTLTDQIYIATKTCEIFPLSGSSSIMVIMMPGCQIILGDSSSRPLQGWQGHNSFYSYDDILNQKYASYVPTYSDWR